MHNESEHTLSVLAHRCRKRLRDDPTHPRAHDMTQLLALWQRVTAYADNTEDEPVPGHR